MHKPIFREVMAAVAAIFSITSSLAFCQTPSANPVRREVIQYQILPSQADPRITRFDDANIVLIDPREKSDPLLVVYLPGTAEKPQNTELLFRVVANQGYRVIGLEYDNLPYADQVCAKVKNPECLGNFRNKRIFGVNVTDRIDDTPDEAIITRLVMLLQYLDAHHPDQGWRRYLDGDEPRWGRIIVAGLSQGAGMAAYIAKLKTVNRVVLFSSPWDTVHSTDQPAPWLYTPSITPMNRWFAEYNSRENTADWIIRAYKALGIPSNRIQIFNLDIPPGRNFGTNPFHLSTVQLPGYIPNWRQMFGHACAERQEARGLDPECAN